VVVRAQLALPLKVLGTSCQLDLISPLVLTIDDGKDDTVMYDDIAETRKETRLLR
jgi:hypothetical protein